MIQDELHKLLTTDASKTAFIHALPNECKKNGYSGFQIDFENVNWTDHDLLSGLIAETAAALHGQNPELTIATVPKVEWDATDRVSWFYFYRDDMPDGVFYTDKRGFQERLNVVRDQGLQGFCSWVLGAEDPEIWTLLPRHK